MRDILNGGIEAFHRDGAVLLKGVLEDYLLRDLEAGIDQAFASPDGKSAGVGEPLRIDHFPLYKPGGHIVPTPWHQGSFYLGAKANTDTFSFLA